MSGITSTLKQRPNYNYDVKTDKSILELRNKLEENDSEETKLLKIQQQERFVADQYRKKKMTMEQTLEILAEEAEKFNEEQRKMNDELEDQKDTLVTKNDIKRKKDLDQIEKDRKENAQREAEIKRLENIEMEKRKKIEELQAEIKKNKIYEDFLRQFYLSSSEFMQEDVDQEPNLQLILDRYDKLKGMQAQLMQDQDAIEHKIFKVNQIRKDLKEKKEQERLWFTSRINEMKTSIDQLNDSNKKMEQQLQGKQLEHFQQVTDFGRVIMSVKNIYEEYSGMHIQNSDKDNTETVMFRLRWIQQRLQHLKRCKLEFDEHYATKKTLNSTMNQ